MTELLRSSKYLIINIPTKLERENHLLRKALSESNRRNKALRRNINRIKQGLKPVPFR